jgi:sugar fermentation stimulation protein A
MQFPQPLARGVLVSRYKRFFADVVLDDGSEVTAHCPNPGAMLGLKTPGLACWLSRSDDPKRKLTYTLELIEADGALVGINTLRANRLVGEALAEGRIAGLGGYNNLRAEVAYGAASRADFRLDGFGRPPCWVEVKSATLARGDGLAEFPDCVSARGLRHVAELQARVAAGERAVILFVVQRGDCDRLALAADLDPAFSAGLGAAARAGVEILAHRCDVSPRGLHLAGPLPVMDPPAGPRTAP